MNAIDWILLAVCLVAGVALGTIGIIIVTAFLYMAKLMPVQKLWIPAMSIVIIFALPIVYTAYTIGVPL